MGRGVCLVCLWLAGCASSPQDHWLGEDKAKHFVVSALIAAAANSLAHQRQDEPHAAVALGFTMAVGLGKEAYDLRPGGTGWGWRDLCWDLLGASTGYLATESLQR